MNTPKLAHVSLIFIGLMWVCPFLYWYHAYPLTTFYQEWMTGVFGVCAMTLLIACKSIEVPRIVLLPIGLMSLAMFQYIVGRVDHLDQVLLFSLYMMFAALLMMLGNRLREELSLQTAVTWLALALFIGAELSSMIGIMQHFQCGAFFGQFIVKKIDIAVYGNIAQPNQFADYIALGLISLWLIYERFSMRIWQVVVLASPMLLVMALSRSRAAVVYLAVILAVIFFRNPLVIKYRKWLYSAAAIVLVVVIAFSIAHYDQSIRLHLWRNSAYIFAQFPMIGAGFGQFAYQNMLLSELHDFILHDLYNNAHSLPLQVAVEFGLVGVIVLFSTMGLFIWRAFKSEATIYHLWGYACLAVIGIHSLVEYPIWYLYFIGIAALLLGMFDNSSFKIDFPKVGRAIIAIVLLLGIVSLVQIYQGYKHMELVEAYHKAVTKNPRYIQPMQKELLEINSNPYLTSYSELFSAALMRIDDHLAQDKLALNERAMRFTPIVPVVYHQSLLLAINGKNEEAKSQMKRAIWAYPLEYQIAIFEIQNMARQDPARFNFLLKFAQEEYAKYRMMVK